MTTSQNKPGDSKKETAKSTSPHKDLETQFPLSEKDEVKKAEQRMNKTAKKK
jgi:hypothetical protein